MTEDPGNPELTELLKILFSPDPGFMYIPDNMSIRCMNCHRIAIQIKTDQTWGPLCSPKCEAEYKSTCI